MFTINFWGYLTVVERIGYVDSVGCKIIPLKATHL